MNVTIFFPKLQISREMLGVLVQMNETNGRVCLFQMDNLERDTKLEGYRSLPGISDW